MEIREFKRVISPEHKVGDIFAKEAKMSTENFRGFNGKRAIHINGHIGGNFPLRMKTLKQIEQFLSSFDGEGRNNNLFPVFIAILNSVRQLLNA